MNIEGMVDALSAVSDPRRDYGNLRHKLMSILVIGLCSTICGGTNYEDMEEFAEAREEWLRTFLDLPNGIPSADTFQRVFQRLDSAQLLLCLNQWLETDPLNVSGGRLVNIDGKTIRGSGAYAERQSSFHVLSAWVHEHNMVLGQLDVDGKSNEITAIPELLDMIDIQGDIVTIDAMGCQKDIAAKIRSKEADYVLAVKGNHSTLYEDIQDYFAWAQREPEKLASYRWVGEIEKDHGRIERREVTTITNVEWLRRVGEWKDLTTIIRYRSTRYTDDGKTSTDRYYISSFETTPEQFGYLIRNHWSIENRLHWTLDVTFREDASKVCKDRSPLNLSVLRKIALSRLQKAPTPKKISLHRKMLRAALNTDFLQLVLFGR